MGVDLVRGGSGAMENDGGVGGYVEGSDDDDVGQVTFEEWVAGGEIVGEEVVKGGQVMMQRFPEGVVGGVVGVVAGGGTAVGVVVVAGTGVVVVVVREALEKECCCWC